MLSNSHFVSGRRFPAFILFGLLVFGIGLAGYLYYAFETQVIKQQTHDWLSAITDLKSDEISRWREERLGDAHIIAKNPLISGDIESFLKGESDTGEKMLSWMQSIVEYYGYESVFLLDREGSIRLSVRESGEVSSYVREQFPIVLKSKNPLLSDLYRSESADEIYISLLAPIMSTRESGDRVEGVLLLKLSPYRFLYPLVQSWPTRSQTAETLLIRREGNEVVYLNELRHRKGTALSLRHPITLEKLPAAMGAGGEEGITEGIDYRGVPVLASIQSISDSPWTLVAKVDLEEIYRPIKEAARLIASFVGLLMALVGVMFALFWSRRERESLRRSRLELEEKVRERTSELLEANEELRFYSTQLERAHQEHEEFTFVAAHDLQEPLRKIQVFSSFLQKKGGEASADEILDKLKRMQIAAGRMQYLISALLNYSKIAVAPELFRIISLGDVIVDAVDELEDEITQSNAHIVVEEELPFIEADRNQIKLLFTHLIDNAMKFHAKRRPEINIHGEVENQSCTIYVEDNGIGFDMRYLDRIFRPFQRLHREDQYGGTGMGLAIARKIVEHHYGTITAESTPGEGSTFIIKLPLEHRRGKNAQPQRGTGSSDSPFVQ